MRGDYLKILNLPDGARDDEIKKAYRTLAKKYHPDISNEENAEEKFVEVAEAYEMLINYPKQHYNKSFNDYFDFDFEQAYQKTARQRAEENARKNFEEFKKNNLAFKKTWYYYPTMALVYFLISVGFIAAIVALLAPLYFVIYLDKKFAVYAYILCLPFAAMVIRLSMDFYRESRPYFKSY